ncbi:hypothetical protein LGH70_22770 [Hymenobacter sp. BT635]|uniref:Uncharacterized protein n=1 Tax=Hymenobacter nitidus TaxID=2880929 RepID=A0ABS8ALP9_9BACT|nr:hypothetical protein [Hymenobacter nitidus]MCB2380434.1 hypothetical protein [Hymenobacter nitidus]
MKINKNTMVHLPLPKSLESKPKPESFSVRSEAINKRRGKAKVVSLGDGVLEVSITPGTSIAGKKLVLSTGGGSNVEIHGINNLISSNANRLDALAVESGDSTRIDFNQTLGKRSGKRIIRKVTAQFSDDKKLIINGLKYIKNIDLSKTRWEATNKRDLNKTTDFNITRKHRKPATIVIGVWDLGAWLGNFPDFLEAMNKSQNKYKFRPVTATVPSGMMRKPEGVLSWLEENIDHSLTDEEKTHVMSNTVANDFFVVAEKIRLDLKIDYLVGVTPSMIAGNDEGQIFWNHFSFFKDRLIIASAYELRQFAKETKTSFETFLAGIITAQLLVAQFYENGLNFHKDNSGCIFDYNADRKSLMGKISNLHIDAECLLKIPLPFRKSAMQLVGFFSKL